MLTGPMFHINISNGSGIVKKVILFFKSYRYKKFSPAETSEISEFWWLYSTSHKQMSPKCLLVGFPHDILYRFRLPTTPNLALYQFVSGFAKFWLWSPGLILFENIHVSLFVFGFYLFAIQTAEHYNFVNTSLIWYI